MLISILIGWTAGRVAQSIGHLTQGVLGSIPGLATYFSFRFFKKGSCQLLAKVCVLVNRLGGLSLPRKSVVRLTDRPDMTIDVYHGRRTTIQQQQLIGWDKNDAHSSNSGLHSFGLARMIYRTKPLPVQNKQKMCFAETCNV